MGRLTWAIRPIRAVRGLPGVQVAAEINAFSARERPFYNKRLERKTYEGHRFASPL
jgi:hypothetical protein